VDAERKLTIVIPVYNEGANICKALEAIRDGVRIEYRILIVYDFDGDSTLPALDRADPALLRNVVRLKNRYGRGVLNAVRSGMEAADSEFVIVTMADLSDPPAVMNDMVKKAEEEGADVVCASRYMKGGKQYGGPPVKGFLSRMAGLTLSAAGLPTHDPTNSFKLYRKSFLEQMTIESGNGFMFGIELVVKAWRGGFRIAEVPTTWRDRTEGSSNFKLFQWLPEYLHWFFQGFFHSERVRKFCFYTFLLLFLCLAVRELQAVMKYMVNVPYWDEWGLVYDFPRHFDVNWLLKLHNEHRIVFTRLLSWLLYQFNGWNIAQGIVLSFYVFLAVFFLFVFYLRKTFLRLPILMLGLGSFFFASFAWCNMLNSFQNSFHWMLFWGMLAVISGFPQKTTVWKDLLFCICCICCMYAMSPVFALPLILMKAGKSLYFREYRSLIWCGTALLFAGLFFIGYEKPAEHPALMMPWDWRWWYLLADMNAAALGEFVTPHSAGRCWNIWFLARPQFELPFFIVAVEMLLLMFFVLTGCLNRKNWETPENWGVAALLLASLASMAAATTARGLTGGWSGRHLELTVFLPVCYAVIMSWNWNLKPVGFWRGACVVFLLCFTLNSAHLLDYREPFQTISIRQYNGKIELRQFLNGERADIPSLLPYRMHWKNHADHWTRMDFSFIRDIKE
jgi:glycosyltransferase, family 2